MNDSNWIDYVTAIGAVATPILVLILTAIGWKIRTRLERTMELEDKLREDRIQAYNQILEPFVLLLMSKAAWTADPKNKGKDKDTIATQKMLSHEYRQVASKMSLVGSDDAVRSYNNLMQYFFERGDQGESASPQDAKDMVALIGKFLLEIRKSMGNESTGLDHWDMLEWFISDVRKYRRA